MNISEKLRIIQKISGKTQTQLSEQLGVSHVAFSNWWTGKAQPRKNKSLLIDELYLQYTGQKVIPDNALDARKQLVFAKQKQCHSLLKKIMQNADIKENLILKCTYNTNSIEGSTLSENETAAILFENQTIKNKTMVEHLEAKNHQVAFEYLLKMLSEKQGITEASILRLHSILMNSIHPDAGFYRQHGVRIVGSQVPTSNYIKIPSLMEELVRDINKSPKDIIRQAAEVHSRFEQIHPFGDGNGRIGRLLLNAMLLSADIVPAVILQQKKRLYYVCLQKSQLTGDSSQLQDFIIDAILDTYQLFE